MVDDWIHRYCSIKISLGEKGTQQKTLVKQGNQQISVRIIKNKKILNGLVEAFTAAYMLTSKNNALRGLKSSHFMFLES